MKTNEFSFILTKQLDFHVCYFSSHIVFLELWTKNADNTN